MELSNLLNPSYGCKTMIDAIEAYLENISHVWFGVSFFKQRILYTTFDTDYKKVINRLLSSIPLNVPFQVASKPSALAETVIDCLNKIYEGKDVKENFPLFTDYLPIYTQKVLNATSLIPAGYLASYGSISKAVGGGPRAVGNVMAKNPFAPLIPCHRVVKSDFTLGGYGLGLQVKRELLIREKRGYTSTKEVKLDKGCLTVFPVEYSLRKILF